MRVIRDIVHPWSATGWWRAEAPDGSLWCESSSEQEVRDSMSPGRMLLKHEQKITERWSSVEVWK